MTELHSKKRMNIILIRYCTLHEVIIQYPLVVAFQIIMTGNSQVELLGNE